MSATSAVIPIGLGCSRLGSVSSGLDATAARQLLRHALDAGVAVFDTADIYGQGDSERYIGEVTGARGQQVRIITKAGQRFTLPQRAVTLAKTPLRRLAKLMPGLRRGIANQRARRLARDYSAAYIRHAVEQSLLRLAREQIDCFLLHSPDADAIARGDCFAALDDLTAAGKLGAWGVSCDDAAAAQAACRVGQVAALQLPLVVASEMRAELCGATARGVTLYLREIYAGLANDAAARRRALAEALSFPGAVVLVGTTSTAHLDETLSVARAIRNEAVR